MKVAVCLYGFARTYQTTAFSFLKHVVTPNDADIFFYGYDNEGTSQVTTVGLDNSKAKFGSAQDSKGSLLDEAQLRSAYGPALKKVHLHTYQASVFIDAAAEFRTKSDFIPIDRFFSMFYNITGSVQLMKDYEAQTGIKYDAVILTRPDLAFYGPIEASSYDLNLIHIPNSGGQLDTGMERKPPKYHASYYKNAATGEFIRAKTHVFTDQLVLGSQATMSALANIYKELPSFLRNGLPCHPETVLFYLLSYKQNRRVVRHKWAYEIFRSDARVFETQKMLADDDAKNRRKYYKKRYHNAVRRAKKRAGWMFAAPIYLALYFINFCLRR